MALKIWGRRSAFNVQKVFWLAGELGLAYQHIPAGGAYGGLTTPEFLALNPRARVPVIDDDGVVIWESHTILRYLAARYGQGTFWSEDPGVRSMAERWMDWAQTALQPHFLQGVFWWFYRTPEHQRNWQAIRNEIARCAYHFQFLDRQLDGRKFLGGDTLSLADIPAATSLYRYFELAIARPSIPNVEAWYRRLQERPAYREHVMVPFEELRGRLDDAGH